MLMLMMLMMILFSTLVAPLFSRAVVVYERVSPPSKFTRVKVAETFIFFCVMNGVLHLEPHTVEREPTDSPFYDRPTSVPLQPRDPLVPSIMLMC